LNLLINAFKYTGNSKRIRLSVDEEVDHVVICVTDNGIGIPHGEINRILEPFYRIDTGLRGKSQGAGLGLAIVSHLVRAHNGALTIESKEGEGSSFRVFLPFPDATALSRPISTT
jgi:signal transduction histidine kinase